MKVTAENRRRVEEELRGAAGRGELELHYQPIYSVRENRFVVCEALVRWRHPTRGLVPPAEFIPIAEETGTIGEIGEWVLRQACAECCTAWPPDVSVSVNFSAAQFRGGNILATLRRALADTGLDARRLEVEVTESLLFNDLHATTLMLRQIRAAGIKLSLDDFGTGFSSLSYLQSLPFNKVKIDRSFLEGLERDSRAMMLLSGIQRLSSDLGMSVVMEGVETPEQMSLVVDAAKVDLVQGYLMSRPLPAREVRAVLARKHVRAVA
jgi:EAL domain-containing protein (putative c-di-GMP-specific phosphodiesterase class I)